MGLPFYRAFDISHDLHEKKLGFKANGNTAAGVVKGAGVAVANTANSKGVSLIASVGLSMAASVALLFS